MENSEKREKIRMYVYTRKIFLFIYREMFLNLQGCLCKTDQCPR